MFGRKKAADDEAPTAVKEEPSRPGAKNRPTPKRRDQEAARKRPLVPSDRKAATKEDRAKARDERMKQREAMMRGDERALPPRDRGPVKRYMRDMVDRRWNLGEFLLPFMVIVLALSFIQQPWARTTVYYVVYFLVVIAVVDSYLLWRRIKKGVQERFHEPPPRGSAMYAIMRSFQMRRSRIPRPGINRGGTPR
ncbi:MAG TPA: DUF3043 domain-containing protein [Segeticoccus sp.]|uniref:DUF3043 domain-containing protein n=1 Tax=Segeticoccus sp. TaxID=2706531 RepID=UPI002D7E876A|nr:DUF3043 domain-containing protein [Segeticoccus sp.]HET8600340.1 DUF3043 domain-containing protein [Segeticoccus sp.]